MLPWLRFLACVVGLLACTSAHPAATVSGDGQAAQLGPKGRAGSVVRDGGGPASDSNRGAAGQVGTLIDPTGDTGVRGAPVSTAAAAIGAPGTNPDAGLPPDGSPPAGETGDGAPWHPLCSLRAHEVGGGIVSDSAQKHHESLVDSQGNLVLIGAYDGALVFDSTTLAAGGPQDGFVIKLDRDCHLVWAKHFGGQGEGALWFTAIARDDADNLYLSGGLSGPTELADATVNGGSGYYGFLIKLDATGALVWKQIYTSRAAAVAVTDVVVDAQHRVTMVGYGGADTSLGGLPIGFLYAASIPFLAQLTTDGGFGWSKTFGSADLLYGLATGPYDDGILLTGWDSSSVDLGTGALSLGKGGRFLAKVDSLGATQWLRALPHGADIDQWNWWKGGIVVDALGNVDVLRDEPQTQPGDSGARLLDDSVEQYSVDGTPTWQRRSSDATVFDHEWGSAVAVFSDRRVVRFGSFTGTARYGGQPVTSRGASDTVLLELAPDGTSLSTFTLGGEQDDHALGVTVDYDGHVFATYLGDETESGDAMDLVVTKLGR